MQSTPQVKSVILSRQLPKTGQVTSYRAGDDGEYEAGWWKGRSVANNKTRFIAKTIGGDDLVIDRATGLMWAADKLEAGCVEEINWTDAIDYAAGLTFAGFSDWSVPNIKELFSLFEFGKSYPMLPDLFCPAEVTYWSSTTDHVITSNAYCINVGTGITGKLSKANLGSLRCVRGGL